MLFLAILMLDSLYPKEVMSYRKEGLTIRRPRISKVKVGHMTLKPLQVGLFFQLKDKLKGAA